TQRFGFVSGLPVLKPNCNLARLQANFLSKLGLPLWFNSVFHLKTLFQETELDR
ncbi:unnamed protein product, partial [Ilex paraguariensis]